jgi:hypothetical protein
LNLPLLLLLLLLLLSLLLLLLLLLLRLPLLFSFPQGICFCGGLHLPWVNMFPPRAALLSGRETFREAR